MRRYQFKFALSVISTMCASSLFAAIPIQLNNQSTALFNSFAYPQESMQEINRHVDFNHTTHIRVQQMYAGHPVWGSDAIIHVANNNHPSLSKLDASKTTMDGTIYQELAADLAKTPASALTLQQANLALQHAQELYANKSTTKHSQKDLIVYVDKNNRAHWAYYISFIGSQADGALSVPTYILDANTFAVYAQWDNLQTLSNVSAGGFGGNPKSGKITYDGIQGNYPTLSIQRDDKKNLCYLNNNDVVVIDDQSGKLLPEKFKCSAQDSNHNNLFWDADEDSVNEGYSPANDAIYSGQVIQDMYMQWYKVPPLTNANQPLKLTLHVHAKDYFGKPMDDAIFLNLTMQMYFGDGVTHFYPLTSLGVGAHEISHGFTLQHSKLTYDKQSGGLNESFSDMAAQAAEFYSTGKNNWQIGVEVVKGPGALRYMDDPKKDGNSIDNIKDYTYDMNVHFSCGVFNKAFYTLATTKGWDTHKAFDVMVKANMDYWTSDISFAQAACGVIKAAKDYQYSVADVAHAMQVVGINTKHC